jgi:hypothetical protein
MRSEPRRPLASQAVTRAGLTMSDRCASLAAPGSVAVNRRSRSAMRWSTWAARRAGGEWCADEGPTAGSAPRIPLDPRELRVREWLITGIAQVSRRSIRGSGVGLRSRTFPGVA